MVNRRETTQRQAQEKQIEDSEKQLHFEEIESRKHAEELQRKIKEELSIKETLVKEQKSTRKRKSDLARIEIDFNDDDEDLHSNFLELSNVFTSGQFSKLYLSGLGSRIYAVKEILFSQKKVQGQKKIIDIYEEVESVRSLRHPNIVSIYGVSLQKEYDLYVAMEFVKGVSLRSLLKTVGGLKISTAVFYLKQLLMGLSYMHSCDVAHKDTSCSNVLLEEESQTLKFINIGYRRKISELNRNLVPEGENQVWPYPDATNKTQSGSMKADIWNVGVVFLQMLFGLEFVHNFKNFDEAQPHLLELPESIRGFLYRVLSVKSPSSRDSAVNLLDDPVFTDSALSENPGSAMLPSSRLLLLPPDTQELSFVEKQVQGFSRYKADFEELEFLGKGGFGQVVKVRNKLDNRYYAIKKIRLDPKSIDYNRKILREVTTLSRLHHQYVIRYYQAWVEGDDAQTDFLGVLSETRDDDDSSLSDSIDEASGTGINLDEDEQSPNTDWLSENSLGKSYLPRSNSVSNQSSRTSWSKPPTAGFFHTGNSSSGSEFSSGDEVTSFSSALGNTKSDPITPPDARGREFKTQYLYIQMEYCANHTLKDAIDDGLDEAEAWRLFREIIEGLCHIHSQGMIHRDLKPSNIFLDSKGHVKIGDFGLATTGNAEAPAAITSSMSTDPAESLTLNIGTPFYTSPELETAGARYNQKVDMYALGIIFFEMCHPMGTGMERVQVLKSLRSPSIAFPTEFSPKFVNQRQIIAKLLSHNPKERFSSVDLLNCELLPARMEDEYVQEAIRTIVNPTTPYYPKLMTALFSQNPDRHKDFTFDFNSGYLHDEYLYSEITRAKNQMAAVFSLHGAIELPTPLLYPKTIGEEGRGLPVHLLDATGQLVELPFDLTLPFARQVSRWKVDELRRFAFDRVFRQNIVGGQPRQVYECDFDIVSSIFRPGVPELEVLLVGCEVLEAFSSTIGEYYLRLNHASILVAILKYCGLNSEHAAVASVLEQLHIVPWTKIRHQLSSELKLSIKQIDNLGNFVNMAGEFTEVSSKISSMLKLNAVSSAIEQLKLLLQYISGLKLPIKIVFDPLLSHKHRYYCDGLVFQFLKDGKKRTGIDVLAAGGCYDSLVSFYTPPTLAERKLHAVGISFSVAKLLLTEPKRAGVDVYVCSFSKSSLVERVAVAEDLWKASISAEFSSLDENQPEVVAQLCKQRGIGWMVILKESTTKSLVLKVKSAHRKYEIESARADLIEKMHLAFAEVEKQQKLGSSASEPLMLRSKSSVELPHVGSSSHLSFTVVCSKKGNQKSILERVSKEYERLYSYVTAGPHRPVEVLVCDLNRDALQKIMECHLGTEDGLKKLESISFNIDRDALSKIKSFRKAVFDKREPFFFLYNLKDDSLHLQQS